MTDWLDVHIGDNRVILDTLPAASVHCVVTSPPYWGLRDYGTATWEGGSEDCDHDTEPIRGTVLDPFAGSGTVGYVAQKLSRRAVLIDLNPDYLEQIQKRTAQVPLGLTA